MTDMNLRPELQPANIDDQLAARLADLAANIDGARPGEWDEWLAEFNQLAIGGGRAKGRGRLRK